MGELTTLSRGQNLVDLIHTMNSRFRQKIF
jgi:hypothetical protein